MLLLSLLSVARAQQPTADDLPAQARRLAEQKPSAVRWAGLAELRRARGQRDEARNDLRRALTAPADEAARIELHELACWRLLPVEAADLGRFREQIAALRACGGASRWLSVFRLYLAAYERDRAALLAAAGDVRRAMPERFPTARAERAHFELLGELGEPRTAAGLDVIAARDADPLHALRDLDRSLTREAEFLSNVGRADEAKQLEATRDGLRRAYLAASRHLVERLFALNLLGQSAERDALLKRARAVPYLTDRQALAGLFDRLDEARAWSLIVEPLLRGEVALLDAPPDLARAAPAPAVLEVRAAMKDAHGETTRYERDVRVRLGHLTIRCDRLTVTRLAGTRHVVLVGTGAVCVEGVPASAKGITADRFTFHSETGGFTFGGDVRLRRRDGVLKLRACAVARSGAVRERRSLLDDFRDADEAGRRALVPRLAAVYADDELPGEIRTLLALTLLRPHLSWHAPYLPPLSDRRAKLQDDLEKVGRDGRAEEPWSEALGGEEWMHADVPRELRAAVRRALVERNRDRRPDRLLPEPPRSAYFWRLRDPGHADVARALRLLDGVTGGAVMVKARRWAAEVRRNNTVLTFDVAGGYAAGKDAPIVFDARNADVVTFKLYRVRSPEDLLRVTDRIGTDFVYQDHGLQYARAGETKVRELLKILRARLRVKTQRVRRDVVKPPELRPDDLVERWESRVADLKPMTPSRWYREWRWREDDWEDRDEDGHHFGDGCDEYLPRLEKSYRPEGERLSSWQCDRVVTVPGRVLAKAGAYVLVAEANGQRCFAPLVVDPLGLTLRRCRDGVFALVADREGTRPVARATLHARGQLGAAITDPAGAAFVRTYAAGDRAIVATDGTRYAVGGFGRVFEGVYVAPWDRADRYVRERLRRARAVDALERVARVYEDRHVIAAYTDRPTYRPGQEVHFKLIVRRLDPDAAPAVGAPESAFRAADFDVRSRLALPKAGAKVRYSVLDPKGREVAHGTLVLNDYGTAASSAALNVEAITGGYALRVHVGGMDRVVPAVFAVKHYRRPTFEIDVAGVPQRVKKVDDMALSITARYYFGQPVAAGKVHVQLVRAETRRSLVETDTELSADGRARLTLRWPGGAAAGRYAVVCSVTDDGGRTVSRLLPLEVVDDALQPIAGLAALPRFVAVGAPFRAATAAAEVVAACEKDTLRFPVRDGAAMVRLPRAGWYRVSAGAEEVDVFAYGGMAPPRRTPAPRDTATARPRWVNVTDYTDEEEGWSWRRRSAGDTLLALFDRQQVAADGTLRLLVYSPRVKPRLLFTIEGRTVVDYVVTTAGAGSYHVVEIPIKERYRPNFYLQGRVLAGGPADEARLLNTQKAPLRELRREADDGSADPRWCRVDVLAPPGGDPETLRVTVEPERREYRPGEEVKVRLRVTDARDVPQAAEVSLDAVDASVYAFGEGRVSALAGVFADPRAPRRFLPGAWRSSPGLRRPPRSADHKQGQVIQELAKAIQEVRSANTGSASLESSPALVSVERPLSLHALGGDVPASSIPLAHLRLDFRETAAWQPLLRTGPDGVARTSFRLPDSLTRYRLTAVAVTRDARLGQGRAEVRAVLPLAVQVLLPRFAVAGDRLRVVALVHNSGPRDRECALTWTVSGARVEGARDGEKVRVSAGATARVGLWLRMDRAGAVKVACRVSAGADADAESRSLMVQPLGRPGEVSRNGTLERDGQGGAQRAVVRLPAGFATRELHLSVTRTDAAQALDGLGYLVEYPYGCIEQTMSRFLPAVIVQHATRRAKVVLPDDVAARLPDVLARGLTRVYGHQHADGSWGWFAKDRRNLPMTAYVVYGLARCQLTGTAVESKGLDRAAAYLRGELRGNEVDPAAAAQAWHALALAGRADRPALAKAVGAALEHNWPAAACGELALACRATGLPEQGQRLWGRARRVQPHGTEALALHLQGQIAFGAPFAECRATASALLALRRGDRWEHTRATARAIEALAEMVAYVPARAPLKALRVRVGGRRLLDVQTAQERGKHAHRLDLAGARLPAGDPLTIEMDAEDDEPIRYALRAAGTQRLDRVEPSDSVIKLRRRFETLDGKALAGPLPVGAVVAVRLVLELERPQSYVLVEDRRPAGCEFADDRLAGRAAKAAAHVEFRDDRVTAFFTHLGAGRHELVYYLRAETVGLSHVLPGVAYPMYAERVRGETGADRIEVREGD